MAGRGAGTLASFVQVASLAFRSSALLIDRKIIPHAIGVMPFTERAVAAAI
jgi:hypothetical protein